LVFLSALSPKERIMRTLSKSKILAFRQCAKRLWLEIHRPELREDSTETEARFEIGHQVGDIARQLFDPAGKGVLIDFKRDGLQAAFAQSQQLLTSSYPIFEAGFTADGAMAFADIMLPARKAGQQGWRMIEVKSSASVKDYQRDDIAVQAYVARAAGVPLLSIELAHIDSKWIYPGEERYQGLLKQNNLTKESFDRKEEVKSWIEAAHGVANENKEPAIKTGGHCTAPYSCGFLQYCQSKEPQAKYPVAWLPRIQSKALKAMISEKGVIDLRKVPDDLLNERQRRVKAHTVSGQPYFNARAAAARLAHYKLPLYFMDFESIQLAVPIWKGTRPYQQIPFQFSVHKLSADEKVEHFSFLDLSGDDPSIDFAKAVIAVCGKRGPIFVYNAGFETARINELAKRFRSLAPALRAINKRIVDLLKVAEQYYYHPSQEGSWGLKKVLPAIAPDLNYDKLEGVQDGGMAMDAYREAIFPLTSETRREEIRDQLLAYCRLDTYALLRLWQFFAGRCDLDIVTIQH
jgi:Domain of unknown function(DUF2779)